MKQLLWTEIRCTVFWAEVFNISILLVTEYIEVKNI